jgi:branched-subunit amino acid aminotransferase/4-amino-4-deoxychorismate lyase
MTNTISINGRITTSTEGILPITSLEVTYGIGVYENVKVRNNIAYFIPQHVNRLLHSASLINIPHELTTDQISTYLTEYISSLHIDSCNIKMILLAQISEGAQLYIMSTAPRYPQKQWYRDGVKVMPYTYERWMPQAKSLNMSPSYFYYKKAQGQEAYDALFIDKKGNVREGSRTNMYVIKGDQIISPPKKDILEGVTLMSLERVLNKNGLNITYKPIFYDEIMTYDGMFLTSTSTKVMPVKTVGEQSFSVIHERIRMIRDMYEKALAKCNGDFSLI